MKPSEIRKEARESLKGKWGKALLIVAAYMLVSYAVESIKKFIGESTFSTAIICTIIDIAYFIISVPFSFGLIISFIKLKRNESIKAWDFMEEGFSRFGKSWGIAWHIFIRLLLPIICIFLISFLMGFLSFFGNSVPMLSILSIALYIATLIYATSRSFLYVLAYYIAYDKPELSSKECVKKSEELMKGNRGNYLLLCLSFFGWILLITIPLIIIISLSLTLLITNILLGLIGLILSMIIFTISILYFSAYIDVATVCFYDRLIKPNVKKIDEKLKIEE